MKKIILLLSLTLTHSTFAQNLTTSNVQDFLTRYCEQTWCNEVEITFESFNCDLENKQTCVLDFTIAETIKVSCTFHRYSSLDEIVTEENELSERFLEELTDCVTTKL